MTPEELYHLLPSVYRVRDAAEGHPLRDLLQAIGEQFAVIDRSLDRFYDDQFIELCAEWVAPYIGDLIGYRPLHGVAAVASPRAEVANTIGYRRRKGTASMLGDLARDVTGWPARAVEFFELLVMTQYLNHVRPGRGGTVDLRRPAADPAQTVDVRGIQHGAARPNIPNIGILLWRVVALPARAPLNPLGDGLRFRFDPLGRDLPVYGGSPPGPLSRREKAWYGTDLRLDGVAGDRIRVCALDGWARDPDPGGVIVDPVLGRVKFADPVDRPFATFHYGDALRLGGGGYDRGTWAEADRVVRGGTGLQVAFAAGGVVEIADSDRYQAPAAIGPITVRAANLARPVLDGPVSLVPGPDGTVVLEGLWLTGPVTIPAEAAHEPARVVLRDCTLVPGGEPSLIVEHTTAAVTLERCVLGPVRAEVGTQISLRDCIIDASDVDDVAVAGTAALSLEACTVRGRVEALRVDISDSLALGRVHALRRQVGCARYSFLGTGSITPPPYHCFSGAPPEFTSTRHGDAGYFQLRASTVDSVRRGASDGAEMGAGHRLHEPLRESNLRIRLEEYVRFGLAAGPIFVS